MLVSLAATLLLQNSPQPPSGQIPLHLDPQAVGVEVGELLPDVELPTIDGLGSARLSDYRGKRILLLQFASW